jgi:hypothetical protein
MTWLPIVLMISCFIIEYLDYLLKWSDPLDKTSINRRLNKCLDSNKRRKDI